MTHGTDKNEIRAHDEIRKWSNTGILLVIATLLLLVLLKLDSLEFYLRDIGLEIYRLREGR